MKYIIVLCLFLSACSDAVKTQEQQIQMEKYNQFKQEATMCFQSGGKAYYHDMFPSAGSSHSYCIYTPN